MTSLGATQPTGTVTYIEWVAMVASAVAELAADSGWPVRAHEVLPAAAEDNDALIAVMNALNDLDAIGVLSLGGSQRGWIADTQNLRKIRHGASLRTAWPSIHDTWLDPDQVRFLEAAVGMSERPREGYAFMGEVTAEDVLQSLGESPDRSRTIGLTRSLDDVGLVAAHITIGGPTRLRPTYAGVVRATQTVSTEWQQRLKAMVEEWETTTIEFKLQLSVGSPAKNAEFAHDVAALANTKASGRDRYLVLGYDPSTREFAMSASPGVTQDRLEDLLNEYLEPAPAIRYSTFVHQSGAGEVGIIEVRRESAQLPYRLRRDGGRHRRGAVFVRHGSHIAQPDPVELAELIAEGDRARAEAASAETS